MKQEAAARKKAKEEAAAAKEKAEEEEVEPDASTIIVTGASITKNKVVWFWCVFTDESGAPGDLRGNFVFKVNPAAVKSFLRENKQFAKPCLRFAKDDLEVKRLSDEHDAEVTTKKEETKEAATKKREEQVHGGWFPCLQCTFCSLLLIFVSMCCLFLQVANKEANRKRKEQV